MIKGVRDTHMIIGEEIASVIGDNDILGFNCDDKGKVPANKFIKNTYPPIGFLPWSILEVGNGDVYGFYWPIGKDNEPPLVSTTYHDSHYLSIFASSIQNAIKILWLRFDFDQESDDSILCEDLQELAALFKVDLSDCSEINRDSHIGMLKVDDKSPEILLEAGKEYIAKNMLLEAEECFLRAVSIVPEYTVALFELCKLYRRLRNENKAIEYMLLTSISPISFGNITYRQQCLTWLKSIGREKFSKINDPLLSKIGELSFNFHEKFNNDFMLYDSIIEKYFEMGEYRKAISLRILTGELMHIETTAFQERYSWSYDIFFQKLKAELQLAGYLSRSKILSY